MDENASSSDDGDDYGSHDHCYCDFEDSNSEATTVPLASLLHYNRRGLGDGDGLTTSDDDSDEEPHIIRRAKAEKELKSRLETVETKLEFMKGQLTAMDQKLQKMGKKLETMEDKHEVIGGEDHIHGTEVGPDVQRSQPAPSRTRIHATCAERFSAQPSLSGAEVGEELGSRHPDQWLR